MLPQHFILIYLAMSFSTALLILKESLQYVFFKQWDMIFYIDAGMKITKDLSVFTRIFTEFQKIEPQVFIAHSDSYPTFKTKLHSQFESNANPTLFNNLTSRFDLNCDYFQTGILLFNSSIIAENTKQDLLDLANMYPISRTNEQGIMNLYFVCKHKLWKAIPVKYDEHFTYDYWNREGFTIEDYCITKYLRPVV